MLVGDPGRAMKMHFKANRLNSWKGGARLGKGRAQ